MLEPVRDLRSRLDQLRKGVRSLKSPEVPTQTKTATRALVEYYFGAVRPSVLAASAPSLLEPLDGPMEELLDCSQRRTRSKRFKQLIADAHEAALALERALVVGHSAETGPRIEPVDQRIVDTLRTLVPAAALSYQQAVVDLQQISRFSWRGPATDLREALRETLDYLAPDREVEAEPGYRCEPETHGPTMRQKVRYVLKKRGMSRTASDTPERAVHSVDELLGSFVRSVYSRSSLSTHTPTDRLEVLRIRDWVRVALRELLELHDL